MIRNQWYLKIFELISRH